MKVLLADGEPEAIKILSSYITNYSAESTVIPVSDSARVIRLAESNVPALLIANAEFLGEPAQVLRTLSERCPEVKVILYASISQSERLQECMRYDILDYMYKPVKQSEFLRCLQRAIDYFDELDKRRLEDSRLLAEYNAERESYCELFLRALLSGGITSLKEAEEGLKYFRTLLEPDYCIAVIQFDKYDEATSSMSVEEKCLTAYKLRCVTQECLRGNSFRVFAEDLSSVAVILSGRIPLAQVAEECEKLKQSIFDRLALRASVGIGSSCKALTDIPRSYREARAALDYRPVLGYNAVIPISVAEPFNTVGYAYPLEAERKLAEYAVMGSYESCSAVMAQMFAALDESMPIAQIIQDIMTSINRRAAERGIDIRFSEVFHVEDTAALATGAEAEEYLRERLRRICGYVSGDQAKADRLIVEQAREYIRTHYYENASAVKLAMKLGTTPEYLERVFMEHEGADVCVFAARLRLLEAKTLIKKTSMDDELIAIKVGYSDVKQFRSEFKEYEKMSVREYRVRTNNP